jgi:hypothetical protein
MFYEIENGSKIEIPDNAFGFTFVCHLPPFGFGKNVANNKIEETDTLSWSDIPEENFWQRPKLPHDYLDKRRKEKEVQRIDPYYVDPYLENIRKREWGRRLRGVMV